MSQPAKRIRMSSTCERAEGSSKYVPVIEVSFPSSSKSERYIVRGISFIRESSAMMAAGSHIRHIAASGLAPWHLPDLFAPVPSHG